MNTNKEGTTSTLSKPSRTVSSFPITFSYEKEILDNAKLLEKREGKGEDSRHHLFIVQPNVRQYDKHFVNCFLFQLCKSELLEWYRKLQESIDNLWLKNCRKCFFNSQLFQRHDIGYILLLRQYATTKVVMSCKYFDRLISVF